MSVHAFFSFAWLEPLILTYGLPNGVVCAPTQANVLSGCAGYLFYPEPFGFDRQDWPHIDAWLDRIAAQPGWKSPYDLMPGNPADRA